MQATEGIILQQVNCQGVMGSGVAAVIRANYPKVFEEYEKYVKDMNGTQSVLGDCLVVQVTPTLYVANIFGQMYYGKNPGAMDRGMYTSYDALDRGLLKLRNWIDSERGCAVDKDLGFANPTIHYPEIGCGLGGGDWNVVSAIIKSRLFDFNQVLWRL